MLVHQTAVLRVARVCPWVGCAAARERDRGPRPNYGGPRAQLDAQPRVHVRVRPGLVRVHPALVRKHSLLRGVPRGHVVTRRPTPRRGREYERELPADQRAAQHGQCVVVSGARGAHVDLPARADLRVLHVPLRHEPLSVVWELPEAHGRSQRDGHLQSTDWAGWLLDRGLVQGLPDQRDCHQSPRSGHLRNRVAVGRRVHCGDPRDCGQRERPPLDARTDHPGACPREHDVLYRQHGADQLPPHHHRRVRQASAAVCHHQTVEGVVVWCQGTSPSCWCLFITFAQCPPLPGRLQPQTA